MWVNKILFDTLLEDNKRQQEELAKRREEVAHAIGELSSLRTQKAKDDISIDWMRHRINALEKERTVLLAKAAGVHLPTPEIVPTRPGSMTVPDFATMPSFEDVGDVEAARLGIRHDDAGYAEFVSDMKNANA